MSDTEGSCDVRLRGSAERRASRHGGCGPSAEMAPGGATIGVAQLGLKQSPGGDDSSPIESSSAVSAADVAPSPGEAGGRKGSTARSSNSVRIGSEVGVDGGYSPTRARARCGCRSSRIRPAASTPAPLAIGAKEGSRCSRSRRRTVEGMEMRTCGDEEGKRRQAAGARLPLSHRRHSGRQPWRLLDTPASGSYGDGAAFGDEEERAPTASRCALCSGGAAPGWGSSQHCHCSPPSSAIVQASGRGLLGGPLRP
jgi:hypothetical protein